MSATDALSLFVSALGVAVALLGAAATRRPLAGLGMMLDLWVAAGLLRLAGDPDWRRALAAAALLVVRKLVTPSLRPSSGGHSGTAPQ